MDFTQEQWDELVARYPPGIPVGGTVTSCQVFGVFVRLEQLPDVPALLELIHFRQVEAQRAAGLGTRPTILRLATWVDARILGWCLKPKDVRLTQLSHLDWCQHHWLAEHR